MIWCWVYLANRSFRQRGKNLLLTLSTTKARPTMGLWSMTLFWAWGPRNMLSASSKLNYGLLLYYTQLSSCTTAVDQYSCTLQQTALMSAQFTHFVPSELHSTTVHPCHNFVNVNDILRHANESWALRERSWTSASGSISDPNKSWVKSRAEPRFLPEKLSNVPILNIYWI